MLRAPAEAAGAAEAPSMPGAVQSPAAAVLGEASGGGGSDDDGSAAILRELDTLTSEIKSHLDTVQKSMEGPANRWASALARSLAARGVAETRGAMRREGV